MQLQTSLARQWIFPTISFNGIYLGMFTHVMTSNSGSVLINSIHYSFGYTCNSEPSSGKILLFFSLHIPNFIITSSYHPYQPKPACLMTNSSLQCCSKTSRMRRTLSCKWVPVKLEGYRKHSSVDTSKPAKKKQKETKTWNKPAWWIHWSPMCLWSVGPLDEVS